MLPYIFLPPTDWLAYKRLALFLHNFLFVFVIFYSCEFRVEMMPLNENDNESVYVNEKSVLQVEKQQRNIILQYNALTEKILRYICMYGYV